MVVAAALRTAQSTAPVLPVICHTWCLSSRVQWTDLLSYAALFSSDCHGIYESCRGGFEENAVLDNYFALIDMTCCCYSSEDGHKSLQAVPSNRQRKSPVLVIGVAVDVKRPGTVLFSVCLSLSVCLSVSLSRRKCSNNNNTESVGSIQKLIHSGLMLLSLLILFLTFTFDI